MTSSPHVLVSPPMCPEEQQSHWIGARPNVLSLAGLLSLPLLHVEALRLEPQHRNIGMGNTPVSHSAVGDASGKGPAAP